MRHLPAAFARIWTLNAATQTLELQASAGMYTHLDGAHARVPVGHFKIGLIAQEAKAHLTNDVLHDARISDPEWARREGMVAFAGYPLQVNGQVLGVMALFAKEALPNDTLEALASVAHLLSQGLERKRAEDALRESSERFQTLADNITPLAWMANPDGWIFWYNKQWFDYTGTTLEEMQGWGWEKVHHPDHIGRVTEKWRTHLQAGEAWEDTFPLRRRDGEYGWFLSRARPIRDAQGKIVRWFGTNTDVTDLRATEEQLRATQGRLRQHAQELEGRVDERTASLNESLKSFETLLYTIAHDLRAPNRAMQGYAQLLAEGYAEKLDDDGRMYLKRIAAAAIKNERLIRDLLEFGRLAHVQFPCHGLDPKPVIEAVVTGLEREIQASKATIRVAEAWPEVWGNDAALGHALTNLVANALKYVGTGIAPKIEIYPKPVSESTHPGSSDSVRLCVKDNGIGVPADQRERIFEPFQRASTESYEGTGMGLAIVRKAAERMGGKAGVDSEPGEGSCFWIELLLASSKQEGKS